jgi:HEAT repeat protein
MLEALAPPPLSRFVNLRNPHQMESPAQAIERQKAELRSQSDDDLLRELQSLAVLPAEDSGAWGADSDWWHAAERFTALADLAAERRLHAAIPLLLARSCYGDPGEMMRGLRHALEAIVAPDYDALTPFCVAAAPSPQPGARLWAVDELGVLRDRRGLDALLRALSDSATEVRRTACRSLSMLTQEHPELRAEIVAALGSYRDTAADARDQKDADRAIQRLVAG